MAAEGRKINLGAGPAALPLEVLRNVQSDMLNWNGTGCSVLEMSHRSSAFGRIIEEAEETLRSLLDIPESYHVLFLQGGASLGFSSVPMNLCPKDGRKMGYIVTGGWSKKALTEAQKYGDAVALFDGSTSNYTTIPTSKDDLCIPEGELDYIYYCANETVHGVEFGGSGVPECLKSFTCPLIADVSSNFLSKPMSVRDHGIVYGGAQKNSGIAGVTIFIVRGDLLERLAHPLTPTCMNYAVMAKARSMYNTPPTFSIYVAGLVYQWIQSAGGLRAMASLNEAKSALLYTRIARSKIYRARAHPSCRSHMNVVFSVAPPGSGAADAALEARFVAEAADANIIGIKGHRSIGGLRASLYNAITLEETKKLESFMEAFELKVLSE